MLLGNYVTQTEYDVTAYRNVLDQLNTLEGAVDAAINPIRKELARSTRIKLPPFNARMSGWAMERYGGKSASRWHEVVGPKVGGQTKYRPPDTTVRDARYRREGKVPPRDVPSFSSTNQIRIRHFVYDTMNLIRNVDWELNRLRIQAPFDMRQLLNQIHRRTDGLSGNYGDAMINLFVIFLQLEEVRKTIIPTMREKLREKIKEAELEKKVAEETLRRENINTTTAKQRAESTETVSPTTTSRSSDNATILPAHTVATLPVGKQVELRKENEKMMPIEPEPQTAAMPVMAGLALLFLLGQG